MARRFRGNLAPAANSAMRFIPLMVVIGMMPARIDANASQFTAILKIQEIAVVEEKLGHDVIGAGVHLCLR
jgi:hypothetical protein